LRRRTTNKHLSNDDIRELILKVLYDKFKSARGIKSIRMKSSEIKRELKKYGLRDNEIVSNLEYLIQTGWVIKEVERFTTIRGGKKIRVEQIYFKISNKGIDYFEGSSKFRKIGVVKGINITNIRGVMVIGDHNVVHIEYLDLFNMLDILAQKIGSIDILSDDEKLEYIADINTIKSQLSKKEPNRKIISEAWAKIKELSHISSLVTLIEKISILLKKFL